MYKSPIFIILFMDFFLSVITIMSSATYNKLRADTISCTTLNSDYVNATELETLTATVPMTVTATDTDPVLPSDTVATISYAKVGRIVHCTAILVNSAAPVGGSDGVGSYEFSLPFPVDPYHATYGGSVRFRVVGTPDEYYTGYVLVTGPLFYVSLKPTATTEAFLDNTGFPITTPSALLQAVFTYVASE